MLKNTNFFNILAQLAYKKHDDYEVFYLKHIAT